MIIIVYSNEVTKSFPMCRRFIQHGLAYWCSPKSSNLIPRTTVQFLAKLMHILRHLLIEFEAWTMEPPASEILYLIRRSRQ